MTGRRRRTTRLAAVAAVLVAAACSSRPNSHSSAAHTAFIKTVGRVCQRAVTLHAGHSFPLANFDPEHPDLSQLPTVGHYFARYGQLPQTVARLHQLTAPAEDAAAWRQLLSVADQMRTNVQRQISAADTQDATTFVVTVRAVPRLTDQLNAAGRRFGFSSNSPCSQVFG